MMDKVFGAFGVGEVLSFVASAVIRGFVVSVVVSVVVKGEERKTKADERETRAYLYSWG
jgi:hypothetical protein